MIERILSPLLEIGKDTHVVIFDINNVPIFRKGFEGVLLDNLLNPIKSFFENLERENLEADEAKLAHPTGEIILLFLYGRKIIIHYPKIRAKTVSNLITNIKLQLINLWKAEETPGVKVMVTESNPSIPHDEVQMDEETIKNIEKFYKIHLKRVEVGNLYGKSWIFDLKKGKELKNRIIISEQALKLLDLKSGDPVIVKPFIESATEKFFG